MIQKFKMPTPGRLGNYTDDNGDQTSTNKNQKQSGTDGSNEVKQIVELLGGKENIEDVDACMTRLRVTVKDRDKVGTEKAWKQTGALGLILKDNGVQAIYGPKADVLKSEVQDYLGD
jgi:PTS system glucose-specific IIC component